MTLAAWILSTLVALFAFDRLMLWMERRGWIYWRRRHASPGTLGRAMLEMQSMVEPQVGHQLEEEERSDEATPGDPPS